MNGKINQLYVIDSKTNIPFYNQALEEFLLEYVNQESLILYLWQNQNTIVIGKNQNAFNECDVTKLENDHGYLARRLSGGGAVYHDLGNLNFTFLSHSNNYDINIQTDIIIDAINKLGLKAYKNGRNDLLIDDKKFSGHAYYSRKDKCYHHGTIMFDVDQDKLNKYLTVSMLKLKDKAISSVKSRVINLKELNNDLTIDNIKNSLINSFENNYNLKHHLLDINDLDNNRIKQLEEKYASNDWRYGKQKKFNNSIERKFDFGIVKVEYNLKDSIIDDLVIYSDSLNTKSIEDLIDILIKKDINRINDYKYDDIQKQIVNFIREEN